MTDSDAVDDIFDEVDTNQDGRIDKKELRSWASKVDALPSSSYESTTYGRDVKDNPTSQYDRYKYTETTSTTSNLINEAAVNTGSSEETKRYLERLGNTIFFDLNPQIIRRSTPERPLTFEQRVRIRCLQPPPPPPPEPLIVKELRPEQPPPPPPLIIREQTSYATSPPPIIFRERPPTPPPRIPGETVTRYLPPVPVPPRSLVVERYPPAAEKPRDIVIERWLPYGPPPERRTIVQPAPPPIKYPAASHTVIVYDAVPSNIVRKFERLGVTQEDPNAYVARYGASLLDPTSLVHQARKAGVTEDISCPILLSSVSVTTHENVVDFDQPSNVHHRGYTSSCGRDYERIQRFGNAEATNVGSSSYTLSASHRVGDSTSAGSTREIRSGYRVGDVGYTETSTKRDGDQTQTEYHKHY